MLRFLFWECQKIAAAAVWVESNLQNLIAFTLVAEPGVRYRARIVVKVYGHTVSVAVSASLKRLY